MFGKLYIFTGNSQKIDAFLCGKVHGHSHEINLLQTHNIFSIKTNKFLYINIDAHKIPN
jgi:hypothetical protein